MSNEHTVKSYEEELRYLIDSVIKMGSLTESQLVDSMDACLLYTSPSPRDAHESRMPSSA